MPYAITFSTLLGLELGADEYHTFRCRDPAHQGGNQAGFLAPVRFRSVGDMSVGPGRGCSLAMWVERRFVGICWPQNLQRALPGEMRMRCICITSMGDCRVDVKGAAGHARPPHPQGRFAGTASRLRRPAPYRADLAEPSADSAGLAYPALYRLEHQLCRVAHAALLDIPGERAPLLLECRGESTASARGSRPKGNRVSALTVSNTPRERPHHANRLHTSVDTQGRPCRRERGRGPATRSAAPPSRPPS